LIIFLYFIFLLFQNFILFSIIYIFVLFLIWKQYCLLANRILSRIRWIYDLRNSSNINITIFVIFKGYWIIFVIDLYFYYRWTLLIFKYISHFIYIFYKFINLLFNLNLFYFWYLHYYLVIIRFPFVLIILIINGLLINL